NEQGRGHQLDGDREANQIIEDREQEVHGATSSRLCASAAISARASADAGIGQKAGRRVCIPISTTRQERILSGFVSRAGFSRESLCSAGIGQKTGRRVCMPISTILQESIRCVSPCRSGMLTPLLTIEHAPLLFGRDTTPGLVAFDLAEGGRAIRLYRRSGTATVTEVVP